QIAKEVCIRAGEKGMIGGSIVDLDKTYVITLQATDCHTGADLAHEQTQAEDKVHALKAVARAAAGMRARLGESLSSIPKPDRLAEETTTSLEGLQAYTEATATIGLTTSLEVIDLLERATNLDLYFAEAYRLLGNQYSSIGDEEGRNKSFTKAFEVSAH